jgi:phosphopantothenoylcysteine decarboxylase / phosphopantothenate---cysteine ligase
MASITIRNLDEAAKQRLRELAARNGRSMEEEARHLLGGGAPRASGAVIPSSEVAFRQPPRRGGSAGRERSVLLVITGGVAAYKSLDLIRRLRERSIAVRCVMTEAAKQFVGEMAVGAISGGQVFSRLWDRAAEHDIGHIRLAREAGLIIVAPATADFIARMAHGLADELASATVLAADSPILLAPAMNPAMWRHPATQRNLALLRADGVCLIGPEHGEMAETGETGPGRMSEPPAIADTVELLLGAERGPLAGLTAIVTSGPTHEPIDPVRYIANRSSGKQGHAIAAALFRAGAQVTLISGPVTLADPPGVETRHVETAREMAQAVETALPADIAVMVAAVADWRSTAMAGEKMKKTRGDGPPALELVENPDILRAVANHRIRPRLVIGFAAETQHLEEHAQDKRRRKNADWIVANDVSAQSGIMGGDRNRVHLISVSGSEEWPEMAKEEVASMLVGRIAEWFRANSARA